MIANFLLRYYNNIEEHFRHYVLHSGFVGLFTSPLPQSNPAVCRRGYFFVRSYMVQPMAATIIKAVPGIFVKMLEMFMAITSLLLLSVGFRNVSSRAEKGQILLDT